MFSSKRTVVDTDRRTFNLFISWSIVGLAGGRKGGREEYARFDRLTTDPDSRLVLAPLDVNIVPTKISESRVIRGPLRSIHSSVISGSDRIGAGCRGKYMIKTILGMHAICQKRVYYYKKRQEQHVYPVWHKS